MSSPFWESETAVRKVYSPALDIRDDVEAGDIRTILFISARVDAAKVAFEQKSPIIALTLFIFIKRETAILACFSSHLESSKTILRLSKSASRKASSIAFFILLPFSAIGPVRGSI